MADNSGGWIKAALDLERHLSTIPLSERRGGYETEERDLKVETKRRQIPAALHAEKLARSEGIPLSEVSAASIAMQAHARYEKLDPEGSVRIRGDVLRGRISARRMVEIAKAAVPVGGPVEHDLQWDRFVIAVSEAIDVGFSRTLYGGAFSDVAKLTSVDMEVVSKQGSFERRSAVFFGPGSRQSAFRSKGIALQIPYLFMAGAFYERVGFFYVSATEFEIASKVVSQARDGHRFELFDLNAIVEAARHEDES